MVTSPRGDPLAFIEHVIAAFLPMEGFRPECVLAEASPRSAVRGEIEHDEMSRSFRYERRVGPGGPVSIVTVHGPPQSRWHRATTKGLRRAGYERWFAMPDQTLYRRWLYGARQCLSELAFLERIGEKGPTNDWPARAVRALKGDGPRPRWQQLRTALDAARSFQIPWTWWCVGFSAGTWIPHARAPHRVRLGIFAFGNDDRIHGREIMISISVSAPFHEGRVVPRSVARCAKRELRAAGYRPPRFRGAKNKEFLQDIHGHREFSNPQTAAKECVRILAHLEKAILAAWNMDGP